MSILRISNHTRPAAERWRGGVVFGGGGGREAAEPPGTNKLRADGSLEWRGTGPEQGRASRRRGPAEEGGRAGGGAVIGWGIFGKYVVEQVLEFMC